MLLQNIKFPVLDRVEGWIVDKRAEEQESGLGNCGRSCAVRYG